MSFPRHARGLIFLVSCCAMLATAQDSPPQLLIDPQGHSNAVWRMVFRPSTDELITVGDKSIRFWDLESGELVRTLRGEIGEGSAGQLHAAALSSDERYLAVGGRDAGNTIRIIDLESDRVAAVLRGHENTILCLDFSDDGLWLASGSIDTEVLVWDLSGLADAETTLEIAEPEQLDAHEEPVYALDFAPDGLRLVTGGDDDRLILWQRESPEAGFEILATGTEHSDDVSAVAFSPGGSLILSGGMDHVLNLWDGETGEFMETTDADLGSSIHAIAFSPDGQRALVSSASGVDGTTAIYDLATNTRLVEFGEHDNRVRTAVWHPDRNLVATGGGDDHDVYLWHPDANEDAGTKAGEVVHHLVGDGRANWSVAFHDTRPGVVAFGRTFVADREMQNQPLEYAFDFFNFEFVEDGDYTRTLDSTGDVSLEKTDENTLAIGPDDQLVTNRKTDGIIRTFTYLPDASEIIVGSSFRLTALSAAPNAEGVHEELREYIGHHGEVKAVSPNPHRPRAFGGKGAEGMKKGIPSSKRQPDPWEVFPLAVRHATSPVAGFGDRAPEGSCCVHVLNEILAIPVRKRNANLRFQDLHRKPLHHSTIAPPPDLWFARRVRNLSQHLRSLLATASLLTLAMPGLRAQQSATEKPKAEPVVIPIPAIPGVPAMNEPRRPAAVFPTAPGPGVAMPGFTLPGTTATSAKAERIRPEFQPGNTYRFVVKTEKRGQS